MDKQLPIAVLISGFGSNLQALIDAIQAGLPAKIQVVISNRTEAYGLERARQAGIATEVITAKDYPEREAYDAALQHCLARYNPQLIVLAGFMRILGATFVKHFQGRLINIHPSLLPNYPGLNTHQRVLEAGDKEHGVSVHFVTPSVDAGPIIAQARLAVNAEDTVTSLQARVHQLEHKLYPEVISWFASQRVALKGDSVYRDQQLLDKTGWQYTA